MIQRNSGKERAHVVYGIDSNTRHADIAADPRMVGIVTAMGRKIESNREALLACCKIAAIKGVAVFSGGKTGILADRPRPLHIHGRIGTADVRRQSGVGVEKSKSGPV